MILPVAGLGRSFTMLRSLLLLAAVASTTLPAAAQTVRFQTSVGSFDMLLNPTNNADLQPLVDNMLANVAAGVYHRSVVNRAVTDFVLQIGSFQAETDNISQVPQFGFAGSNSFDPVIVDANNDGQVDFNTSSLNNTRGTVSLALSSSPNTGSASFFINLVDNSFLDSQGFVPFAEVSDLSTVERIMSQPIVDLSGAVGQNGSLAYTDVPLADDGDLIVIENVAVVSQSNQAFVGPLQNRFSLGVVDEIATAPETPTTDTTGDTGGGDEGFVDPLAGLSDEVISLLTDAQITGLLNGTLTAEQVLASLDLTTTTAAAATASASVPEPSAALLAGFALLAAARRR